MVRRVRTASGATAVQIAEYDGGRRKIVAHVGSARTGAELGILLERAREMLADPAQGAFDLGIEPAAPRARLVTREAAPALFDAEPRSEAPVAAAIRLAASRPSRCSASPPSRIRVGSSPRRIVAATRERYLELYNRLTRSDLG